MAVADDYADLPDWIRPGAKLAVLLGGALVTVTRITRTQIVATRDGRSDGSVEYRFDRTPIPANPPYRPNPEYRRRGAYGDHLVQRSHPHIVEMLIDQAAQRAAQDVEAAYKVYRNPKTNGDSRPVEERAMDLLDAIENAARKARRKVERLIDPGGHLAAEYAQDLATTTDTQEG